MDTKHKNGRSNGKRSLQKLFESLLSDPENSGEDIWGDLVSCEEFKLMLHEVATWFLRHSRNRHSLIDELKQSVIDLLLTRFQAQRDLGYDPESFPDSFNAWLRARLNQRCIDVVRSKAWKVLTQLQNGELVEWDGESPLDALIQEERSERLRQALQSLGHPWGYVLQSHYLDGRSVDELAQELSRTRRQVYDLLDYGKEKLRRAFPELGESSN